MSAAIIGIVPISILLFGGNEGIVDRLLGVSVQRVVKEVKPPGSETKSPAPERKLKLRSWLLLSLLSLGWGALSALLLFLAFAHKGGTDVSYYEEVQNPSIIARFWTLLPMGIRSAGSHVGRIQIIRMRPSEIDLKSSDLVSPLNPGPYFQSSKSIEIVRVSLVAPSSLLISHQIMANFLGAIAPTIQLSKRPQFRVLQFVTKEDYGPFSTTYEENIMLCLMESGGNPIDFYRDPRPVGHLSYLTSFERIEMLLLGDVGTFEATKY